MLGALVCAVVALLLAMIVAVFVRGGRRSRTTACPGSARVATSTNSSTRSASRAGRRAAVYTFHAWPLIWSTILITGISVGIALVCSLFIAVFVVEFAPEWMRSVLEPVIRFLASVPSVIYGLLGVLVVVPFIGNHLVTEAQKASVAGVISLSGYSLMAAILILTVMIAPLMVAIFADGLRSVRPGWLEGSLALGINRWRTTWKIAVRTARPAIVAGTVLAVARAIGEAVMLAMVSGSVGFAPNPADGLIFFYEPSGRWPRRSSRTSTSSARSRQRDAVRDRHRPALLGGDVLAGRLGRAASDGQVRGGGRLMDASLTTPPARPPAGAATTAGQGRGRGQRHLAPLGSHRPGRLLGAGHPLLRDRHRDRRLSPGQGPHLPEALDAGHSGDIGVQRKPDRRFLRRSDRHPDRRRTGDLDCPPGGGGSGGVAGRVRPPAALARITESTIEAIAGIPSIVLALFGTVIFSSTALGFLSRTNEGVVFGRSFFAAAAMLSLVALPLVVTSTREGLRAIPQHVREASYAVGKTKGATTRRILLPASRPQVATGAMLGLGRIIGDTAIVLVLLGAIPNFAPVGGTFPLNYLRGAGTTLTNYVYQASPTGNLNQPNKAYAAAFVLLVLVLILNAAVDVVHRRSKKAGTWSS